ncbi:C40 family peptidase [Modestobacter marinus]|uniref:C40 family peptidase n=1 Tax=Modestobacter marinus TaxID=477641 RepID=UPI001C98D144|nr:C40 family peptidase [Modestobacter marinus]
MARSHSPARRRATPRRVLLTLLVAGGVALTPLPALADPTTSGEAATLVAEKAHELEVVTEQFNDAREELKAKQAAADEAAAQAEAAETALTTARDSVREVARSAYTGERLSTLEAMLSSSSSDELMDRVGTLDVIAAHNTEVLAAAQAADDTAKQAQDAAARAAADARGQVDRVAAQQSDLNAQIADYQAQYERLTAAEQAASRADAERSHSNTSALPPGAVPAPAAPPAGPVVGGSGAAQAAVSTAMAQVGDPYVWAAAGPNSFDCSGLVQYAYAAAGISLPHSSKGQASTGRAVSRGDLQPGDVLAFYSPVSHVGIYIGNGQMVHAPTSGSTVKVVPVDYMGQITAMRRLAG